MLLAQHPISAAMPIKAYTMHNVLRGIVMVSPAFEASNTPFCAPIAAQRAESLTRRRLPKLDAVSFRVHDPAELAVFGFLDFRVHVAAFAT
jgi:hypothetical protein